MTDRKAIFLDVDGTYAHHGIAPVAHEDAVRNLRAADHHVLLCTGRPKSMLSPKLLAPGFDGLVAAAGGYVEFDGEVLADRRFPADVAARVVSVLDSHGVAYVLEAPERVYGPLGVDIRLESLLAGLFPSTGDGDQKGQLDILAALEMSADLSAASFGKVSCFGSPVPVSELAAEMGPGVGVVASSLAGMDGSAGEFYQLGVHKAVGIQAVVEHLGIGREDVVAAGDGLNDVEMLAYAGVGIAIDGAHPDVLAAADFVTPGPDDAGLVAAFAKLGLL
ncbi:HAD hydrolase family protein [Sinomonas sp. ASV322]|uniref:HAD hydrolase family protein n=1 Tax=Sinomonas sp. ASV322 TaxID=3041920 RepID=UPI0027DD02E1|nr:HAD hydrolase family protein [Sinomonas sp. ASV322]MDQ4503135.1 HAD hydrolase family protein [Sinomonas sp. ASV322]